MTFPCRAASLLTGLLLLAAGTRAQTPLGQPTLDEQKVQVWCATARYVYDDNGRSNLKSKLQCGSSLNAFEASIKADSQRVYSALYQPLEGKGTMYKGLSSNSARLQKLTTEIITRLKASPARRANPARMERLATLETALNNYVQNGTPIGDLSTADMATEVMDTTAAADDTMGTSTGDAGLAEAGVGTQAASSGSSGAGDSLMNKLFGPLALIFSLLSLVLYYLMRKNIGAFQKELSARIDKRRDEILALQNAPAGGPRPAGQPASDRLTPAQQREVEKLVQLRVEEEVKKLRSQLVGVPAAGAAAVATAKPVQPVSKPAPAPAPVAQPVAPVAQATAPAAVYSGPAQPTEVPAMPPVIPAGPPSASPRDEFESLVPPVQLPVPDAAVPAAAQQQTRYVKVPVNGAFSEYDLSDEPQHDSIYEIHLDPQWPELATFSVTSNQAVHAYAIQSAQYSLREACKYQQPANPVTRIVTEEEGVLRKMAGAWQIEQKAAIRFE
jgi:preprotein translocase subunit SecG